MTKQLSSFDIYVICSELENIKGSFIDKIYQLSRDEVLIRFRNINTKQKESLYIRNGELFALTKKDLKTPQKPTTFAMTLRKYLQNGKISQISQHEFDRIIKLQISKKEGNFSLILEFFANGNIILTDPTDKIIIPLIRQSWSHRAVKGRIEYKPPPSQINPFKLSQKQFDKLINESTSDLVRTLAVNINLSGQIAEEICSRAEIDKKTNISDLKDQDIKKTYSAIKEFLEIFKNKDFEPYIVKKDGEIIDSIPFIFDKYKNFDLKKVDSFTKSLEHFIKKSEEKDKPIIKKDDYIAKLERKLAQQKKSIEKFEKQIKEKKIKGDIIYLNYQKIESLLNEINQILNLKDKEEEIKKINNKEIVKVFDPFEKKLILNLKDSKKNSHEIKIDYKKTVAKNAENAYDSNKKLKHKLKGAEKSVIVTKKQIIDAQKKEKIKLEKQKLENKTKKEKIYWFEKYRWFISSNGNIVIGGKDAKTNDLVVKKYLKEGDRYAHADIQGAPSIIIKSKGIDAKDKDISEETLKEACIFAASYSKAWKQFAEAQAYWVHPEQVSKTAQSGEFVPKGAFIIRGKRNYNRCKLEIAVGEINIQDDKKIMGGPVSAVKAHSKKYIILEPGGTKKSEISKKISKIFDVNVDKVNQVLPSGGMQIIRSEGVEI